LDESADTSVDAILYASGDIGRGETLLEAGVHGLLTLSASGLTFMPKHFPRRQGVVATSIKWPNVFRGELVPVMGQGIRTWLLYLQTIEGRLVFGLLQVDQPKVLDRLADHIEVVERPFGQI